MASKDKGKLAIEHGHHQENPFHWRAFRVVLLLPCPQYAHHLPGDECVWDSSFSFCGNRVSHSSGSLFACGRHYLGHDGHHRPKLWSRSLQKDRVNTPHWLGTFFKGYEL